jgi:hypothetical protein
VNQNVEEDVLSLKQEVSKLQQQLHQLKNRLKGNSKEKAVSEGMIGGDVQIYACIDELITSFRRKHIFCSNITEDGFGKATGR